MKHYLLIVAIASALLASCAPRESPREPVPTNYPVTLTPSATSATPAPVSANSVPLRLGEPFALKLGQSATIPGAVDGFGFEFHSVFEDSRCPKQINCIVQGQARIYIEPMRGVIPLPPLLELATYPLLKTKTIYEGYTVELKEIAPYPERDAASKEIARAAYVATFVVTQSETLATPTIPASGVSVRLNEPFTIKVSQSVTVQGDANTRITFTNISEDSRCPSQVNCVQPGRARVLVTIESGGKLARFDFSNSPADRRTLGAFNNYLIEFITLDPYPEKTDVRIPLSDYRATLRVKTGSLPAVRANFNEPFALRIGQTASVGDDDVRLTMEPVSQDSRCPTRVLCATSGNAVINVLLEYGGKQERYTLDTEIAIARQRSQTFRAYSILLNALTPYPQSEFASKEIAPSDYQATFVVQPLISLATPTPQAISITTPQLGCADLTRRDAEEILGEATRETSATMNLFQPQENAITVRGLCGYGSVAFTPNKSLPKNLPNIFPTTIPSDHAVVAGKLTDSKRQEQLLSVASAIYAANPNAANPSAASPLYFKLLTIYASGAWSQNLLNDFPDAARGASNVRVERVDGLGEKAVWVWREFSGGRYAALIAQKGETLFIVTALVGEQRAETGLLAAMINALKRML